jgi:hypothetical protein
MSIKHSRHKRERKTVDVMIGMYCQEMHMSSGMLCTECEELQNYARNRLDNCPYEAGKTTCVNCPTHCYIQDMRKKILVVMRYAGPRMIYRHPILALCHFMDGLRKKPLKSLRSKNVEDWLHS